MKISLDNTTKEYRQFIGVTEYIRIKNDEIGDYKKQLVEEAKLTYNDPDIYRVYVSEMERDTNTFYIEYSSKNKSKIDVEPGVYDLVFDHYGTLLFKTNIHSSNKILPIHTELKTMFEKIDFSKKNNILVYGDPGNGKTQSIIDLANYFKDVVFIKIDDIRALKKLKNIKDDIKKVLIFEEFTETIQRSEKKIILNFLDGIDSIPNTISIMSTNYPKELEMNIIDRPSRVRHFLEYKNPNPTQIDVICEHFNVKGNFFYKKDYSVDNIINIINTSSETQTSLSEAEKHITSKRKFLSETFKSGGGAMGIGGGNNGNDFDDIDD
jgi:DNA replication protein DnaC